MPFWFSELKKVRGSGVMRPKFRLLEVVRGNKMTLESQQFSLLKHSCPKCHEFDVPTWFLFFVFWNGTWWVSMLRCSAVIRAYRHHVACEWLLYFTKSFICFLFRITSHQMSRSWINSLQPDFDFPWPCWSHFEKYNVVLYKLLCILYLHCRHLDVRSNARAPT
jgi:hypothetical protein